MEHMTSFKIGKVEVYAKIIDRKVTYEDGWFYLEPKEEDLFTHFFAHSPDNYRENKTKFSADNIFCEKVSTYSTNKVKRHQHNNRTRNPIYSIWTVPLGTKFPEDIWKFCNLRDYYDMFPKKVKEVVAAEKAVNDVVYYDRHLRREACKRTTFARRYEIEKPLFYSLFENNHSKESILYTRGDLYHFDLKEKGNLIGLIPRNLKILKAWGYNLICIDGEYTFSKKVYIELKRSLFNDIIGHRDNLEITSTDDQDIRYIKACRKEGRKGGNDLDCDNSSLPEHLKAFVAKEKEKIVSARYRIDKRYPFIKHLSYSELRGVDKWMSSYLIPLLLSNPQMEQNKLEKPTTDLN